MDTLTKELTVSEAALHRVSIRKFTDRALPEGEIREILRLAGTAPSAWNVQPWRVHAVTDFQHRQDLMAAAFGQPQVGSAPVVFVVSSDMEDAIARAEDFIHPGMADTADKTLATIRNTFGKMSIEDRAAWGNHQTNIFLGFLMLVAEARGWSSSPMLGFDPGKVRTLLGIPAHSTIAALLAVGERAEDGFPQYRHSVDRFTTFV
jgi:nitroreductase